MRSVSGDVVETTFMCAGSSKRAQIKGFVINCISPSAASASKRFCESEAGRTNVGRDQTSCFRRVFSERSPLTAPEVVLWPCVDSWLPPSCPFPLVPPQQPCLHLQRMNMDSSAVAREAPGWSRKPRAGLWPGRTRCTGATCGPSVAPRQHRAV